MSFTEFLVAVPLLAYLAGSQEQDCNSRLILFMQSKLLPHFADVSAFFGLRLPPDAAVSLPPSTIAVLREVVEQIFEDAPSNGLSVDRFRALLSTPEIARAFPAGGVDVVSSMEVFEQIGANADGFLRPHDAMKFFVAVQVSSLKFEHAFLVLTQLFEAADADRSGTLTRDELKAAFQLPEFQHHLDAIRVSSDEYDALFQECDVNGDGDMTLGELIQGFCRLRNPTKVQNKLRIFVTSLFLRTMGRLSDPRGRPESMSLEQFLSVFTSEEALVELRSRGFLEGVSSVDSVMREWFDAFDVDGSGDLTCDELVLGFAVVQQTVLHEKSETKSVVVDVVSASVEDSNTQAADFGPAPIPEPVVVEPAPSDEVICEKDLRFEDVALPTLPKSLSRTASRRSRASTVAAKHSPEVPALRRRSTRQLTERRGRLPE